MISTTFDAKSVFLLTDVPNWRSGVNASFAKASSLGAGQTDRENREPTRASTIATIEYATILTPAAYVQLRASLGIYDKRPILCPFWPAAVPIGGQGSVIGTLKIWFERDFSSWELGVGSAPVGFEPSGTCLVAPVMWGEFVELPEHSALNGPARGTGTARFRVVETGTVGYALAPNPVTLSTQTVNTVVVPNLEEKFTWGKNTAQSSVRVRKAKIGEGRGNSDVFYSQPVRETYALNFTTLTTAGIRHILTLFANRKGSVGSFRCPTPWDPATKNLVRFTKDVLNLKFRLPDYARKGAADCEIEVITVPYELVPLSGETMGQTMGELPGRWYGYEVTDGASTWRYTSYESTITHSGGNFEPREIEHGRVVEEIDLEIGDCPLEVRNWEGSPFTRLQRQPTCTPMFIKIFEGLISNPSAAHVIYSGRLMAPDTKGPIWKLKIKSKSSFMEIMGPRLADVTTCRAVFGDIKCKVDLAPLRSTQALQSVAGGVATFSTGSANEFDDQRFANGYAERPINGGIQRYAIAESFDSSGNLACRLVEPVIPAPTGVESGWVLTPGCRLGEEHCKAWGNFVNFRGAPDRPTTNPAMNPVKSSTGGKK